MSVNLDPDENRVELEVLPRSVALAGPHFNVSLCVIHEPVRSTEGGNGTVSLAALPHHQLETDIDG